MWQRKTIICTPDPRHGRTETFSCRVLWTNILIPLAQPPHTSYSVKNCVLSPPTSWLWRHRGSYQIPLGAVIPFFCNLFEKKQKIILIPSFVLFDLSVWLTLRTLLVWCQPKSQSWGYYSPRFIYSVFHTFTTFHSHSSHDPSSYVFTRFYWFDVSQLHSYYFLNTLPKWHMMCVLF